MRQSASRLLATLGLLILGTVLCGASVFLVLSLLTLPDSVEGLGPPAAGLDPVQRTALGVYLAIKQEALDRPAGDAGASLEMEVEEGEPAESVVGRLVDAGIVRDGFLLRSYLRYQGLDVGIQAGRYLLTGEMTPRQIGEALQTARPSEIVVTVVEGWRREQIADLLEKSDLAFGADAFLRASSGRPGGYSFSAELPANGTLEGFLFPDTYLLKFDATAEELVLEMLDNFDRRVDARLRQGFEAQGFTVFEAVTLASIIEREAVVAEERPLIASVFLNRLSIGMKLDADPTVQYALGGTSGSGWWKAPLSLSDLQFDSPYNTYMYPGLPPGPIANPGLASLEAVAFPQASDYLYFRAACDRSGRHLFAFTFEEHVANACP